MCFRIKGVCLSPRGPLDLKLGQDIVTVLKKQWLDLYLSGILGGRLRV
jgi:hypothetical protein